MLRTPSVLAWVFLPLGHDFLLKDGNFQTLPDIMISAIKKTSISFFSPFSVPLNIALLCVLWSGVFGVGIGPASFCIEIVSEKRRKKWHRLFILTELTNFLIFYHWSTFQSSQCLFLFCCFFKIKNHFLHRLACFCFKLFLKPITGVFFQIQRTRNATISAPQTSLSQIISRETCNVQTTSCCPRPISQCFSKEICSICFLQTN